MAATLFKTIKLPCYITTIIITLIILNQHQITANTIDTNFRDVFNSLADNIPAPIRAVANLSTRHRQHHYQQVQIITEPDESEWADPDWPRPGPKWPPVRTTTESVDDYMPTGYVVEEGKVCSTDNICVRPYSVCVDDRCYCAPGYKYNVLTQHCVRYNCTLAPNLEIDCSPPHDPYRSCRAKGQCVCDEGYAVNKTNGQQCVKGNGDTVATGAATHNWHWAWILVVIPIILGVVIAVCLRRKHRMLKESDVDHRRHQRVVFRPTGAATATTTEAERISAAPMLEHPLLSPPEAPPSYSQSTSQDTWAEHRPGPILSYGQRMREKQ